MRINIPEFESKKIDAIIFDLGAVILNIDYQLAVKSFENFGLTNFDKFFAKANQHHLFDDFEKGIIAPFEFRNRLRKAANINLTDEQIDTAWNSMLLDLPLHRFELLQKLKEHYPLYLLSNTNQIHIDAFTIYLDELLGANKFESLFTKIYYSNKVKMRKPDAAIFELVISENNLNVATTLFIDDSPQHIEGAKKVGLNAFHLKDGMDVVYLFDLEV